MKTSDDALGTYKSYFWWSAQTVFGAMHCKSGLGEC